MWWVLRKNNFINFSLFFNLIFIFSCTKKNTEQEQAINLLFASSLIKIEQDFRRYFSKDLKLNVTFEGSSLIANHVEQGAPCDAIIVADDKWNEYLLKNGLVEENSFAVLKNELSLASLLKPTLKDDPKVVLSSLSADQKIILADPEYVPLGRYSKEALEHLKLFESLSQKYIFAYSALNAVQLLLNGAGEFALLYSSDIDNKSIFEWSRLSDGVSDINYTLLQCRNSPKDRFEQVKNVFLMKEFGELLSSHGFIHR